jgi:hypothetical protein
MNYLDYMENLWIPADKASNKIVFVHVKGLTESYEG